MQIFRQLGVPDALVGATRTAALRTQEPIVLMIPLLWLAASTTACPRVVACVPPCVTMIGEIPSYALDKHTSAGKLAIQRLARENRAVREALAAHVRPPMAIAAAAIAAFYADAAPVSLRYLWDGSADLERLGVEADMLEVGVRQEGIEPVLNVVRENLKHLDAIRAEVFKPASVAKR